MKKSRGLIVTLVPLFIVGVGLWFWPGTAAFAGDDRSSSHYDPGHDGDHKGGHEGDEGDKCTVCHDPHHFHEISIPCGQVDKFLQDHPGDFPGHCETTPSKSK